MTRVILLNGPRGVGKDFIADAFIDTAGSARKMPIMWPLKLEAMAEYNKTPSEVMIMEDVKDDPDPELRNMTPREVYIAYGNRVREEHGQDYPASLWRAHSRRFRGYGFIVVPDVRFQEEVDAMCLEFGAHNTLLVRVTRQHHTWKGDIGSYLKHWLSADMDNSRQRPDVGETLTELVNKRMLL